MEIEKPKVDTFRLRWKWFFKTMKKRNFLQYYLIDAHLNYSPEPANYKKDTKRGLLVAIIYATFFGLYESLLAFDLFDGFFEENLYIHWGLWWITTVIISYIATNRRWDQIIMSLLVVINFEDLVFWIVIAFKRLAAEGYWANPFPAGNWWDEWFASFRVLGGWGTATSFWPFVPRYYYIVLGIGIFYYLMSILGGPKYGQIADWIILPGLLPVLIGLITSEFGFERAVLGSP